MKRATHQERFGSPRGPLAAWPLIDGTEPPLAAHIVSSRALYTHHGLYAGNGRVIHYSGLARGLLRGPVEETSLEKFACGGAVFIVNGGAGIDAATALKRARSRLGERRYRILSNNCEHFCEWCLHGVSRSYQVERWRAAPRRVLSGACRTLALAASSAASKIFFSWARWRQPCAS
jgi:hypothetical protein